MPTFEFCRSLWKGCGQTDGHANLGSPARLGAQVRSGLLTVLLGAILGLAVSTRVVATPSEREDNSKNMLLRRVVIRADGKAIEVLTAARTVEDLLTETRVPLTKLDRCSARLSARLKEGMIVEVTRVKVDTVVERTPIPFPTRRRYSTDLSVGETVVKQPGIPGEKAVTYHDYYRNGERTQHVLWNKSVKPPVPQIEVQGLRGMTLASRHLLSGRRMITMRASAYGPSGNGGWGMRTSSGMRPGHGVVAVDPQFIRLGTRLYIEGYGVAVAGDTGGAIKGDRIDLGMESDGEAWRYGRRTVRVIILD